MRRSGLRLALHSEFMDNSKKNSAGLTFYEWTCLAGRLGTTGYDRLQKMKECWEQNLPPEMYNQNFEKEKDHG